VKLCCSQSQRKAGFKSPEFSSRSGSLNIILGGILSILEPIAQQISKTSYIQQESKTYRKVSRYD
jgi:hypothetical protein